MVNHITCGDNSGTLNMKDLLLCYDGREFC